MPDEKAYNFFNKNIQNFPKHNDKFLFFLNSSKNIKKNKKGMN